MKKEVRVRDLWKLIAIWTILVVCLGISTSWASVTQKQVQEVYRKLYNVTGVRVPLVFVDDDRVNAAAKFNKITINTGMLRFLNNKDEIAFVLGHESAHIFLQHLIYAPSPTQELQADKMAKRFTDMIGYNGCVGSVFLLRMNEKGDSIHPPSNYRFNLIQQGC